MADSVFDLFKIGNGSSSPNCGGEPNDHCGDPGATGDREGPHASGVAGLSATTLSCSRSRAASGLTIRVHFCLGGSARRAAGIGCVRVVAGPMESATRPGATRRRRAVRRSSAGLSTPCRSPPASNDRLKRNGRRIDPALLTCEIIETAAIKDIGASQETFRCLNEQGTQLSIADLGSGSPRRPYLRQLPAEALKIDASFVKDVDSSADAFAVVDAVVDLAHALGLKRKSCGAASANRLSSAIAANRLPSVASRPGQHRIGRCCTFRVADSDRVAAAACRVYERRRSGSSSASRQSQTT